MVELDFIWMDPAENQQMIIFRQVMQCLDDGIESLVAAEKAEDPDQLAPARDVIEHRKFLPGCRAPNIRHFGGRQKRQGMVIPHSACRMRISSAKGRGGYARSA